MPLAFHCAHRRWRTPGPQERLLYAGPRTSFRIAWTRDARESPGRLSLGLPGMISRDNLAVVPFRVTLEERAHLLIPRILLG
jgi:hypothetical protein